MIEENARTSAEPVTDESYSITTEDVTMVFADTAPTNFTATNTTSFRAKKTENTVFIIICNITDAVRTSYRRRGLKNYTII